MDLCLENHPEQLIENCKYKGRVVFHGDQVKDQEDTHALFNEQASSSSHMSSAKLLDAMARVCVALMQKTLTLLELTHPRPSEAAEA